MRKQICSLALSTLFGLGLAIAAPQAQDQPAPPSSAQPQSAQEPGHRDGGGRQFDPNRQLQLLSKRLNLTDAQQNQILPILTSRRQQMESLRADSSLSPKDIRTKMHAIREDGETQIRALLTDSQKQTYDQLQQQRREREQQHRQGRQAPAGGAASLQ